MGMQQPSHKLLETVSSNPFYVIEKICLISYALLKLNHYFYANFLRKNLF
jgi:hypothetical protein